MQRPGGLPTNQENNASIKVRPSFPGSSPIRPVNRNSGFISYVTTVTLFGVKGSPRRGREKVVKFEFGPARRFGTRQIRGIFSLARFAADASVGGYSATRDARGGWHAFTSSASSEGRQQCTASRSFRTRSRPRRAPAARARTEAPNSRAAPRERRGMSPRPAPRGRTRWRSVTDASSGRRARSERLASVPQTPAGHPATSRCVIAAPVPPPVAGPYRQLFRFSQNRRFEAPPCRAFRTRRVASLPTAAD